MTAYVHDFSWRASVSADDVFEALTAPDALRTWFAEHVDVALVKGGAFRFWGKHTLETPSQARATQMLTAFDPPNAFGFTWTLFGVDSEVAITLEKDDGEGGAKVTGRHTFAAAPALPRFRELIDDLWRLHGGNLAAYLDGGDGLLLPDFDDPNPEIRQSILIDASREDVFKALIEPNLLAQWLDAENAVVEPRKGGAYSYGWRYDVAGKPVAGGPTKILEYVENEKLVTDWPDWRGDASVPVQSITWLLADEGSKTRLTLIHSGFIRAADISDYPFGWGHFLGRLKDIAEAV